MQLRVKYLNKNLPKLISKEGDSGYDIRASIEKPLIIPARGIALIPAGICLEVTDYPKENGLSVEIQIRPRSGMTKNGIVAQLGTIDASYRGELKTLIYNFNDHDVEIMPFDRIAQIIICPVYKPEIVETENLSDTERGGNGFGSSGKS